MTLKLFKNWFSRKEGSERSAPILYNANQTVLDIYPNFLSGEYSKCIGVALNWIDSVPYSEHILKIHNEMLKMTEPELLRYCSLNYDKGISEGERHRIYRKLEYGPVKRILGSGILFLILAYSYDSLGDFRNGLMWKSHVSDGLPRGTEFLPFETWRIVELSTVKNLSELGFSSEVEYVKSWLDQDSLSFSYIPRDIIERDLLGETTNMKLLDRYTATIDYQSEFYRVNSGSEEITRYFGLKGIKAIIDDLIHTNLEK